MGNEGGNEMNKLLGTALLLLIIFGLVFLPRAAKAVQTDVCLAGQWELLSDTAIGSTNSGFMINVIDGRTMGQWYGLNMGNGKREWTEFDGFTYPTLEHKFAEALLYQYTLKSSMGEPQETERAEVGTIEIFPSSLYHRTVTSEMV